MINVKLLRRQQWENLILPIALKLVGSQIITRRQISTHTQNSSNLSFGFEESIVPNKPNIIGEIPEAIQITSAAYAIDKSFVLEIEDAQLVGSAAVGFDRDGNIIAETTLPPLGNLSPRLNGSIPIDSLFIKKLPRLETQQLDTACSLVNHWSKSYYHWFLDCLTRIEGLEYYQEQKSCKPVLIIDSNPTSWQIESLQLLGYSADDYIQWDQRKITVKKLVVPAFRQPGNWVSPSALNWLRQRLFSNLSTIENHAHSFSPRIYISRSQASGRQVINEDEVIKVLSPLGFVSYSLENMSFVEQIRLFLSAEIIIGPHGAGFTNIIFSRKKPIVVELVTPWVSPHYFLISTILDFPYWSIECHQPYSQKVRQTRGNLIVDIANLKSLVEQIT